MAPRLSSDIVRAVPPVESAIEAELARVPADSAQAIAVHELGASLRRRAALDDEVARRRAALMPGEPDEVLERIFADPVALIRDAETDPRELARVVGWLVEADLPETPDRPADGGRDPSTAYQAQPAPSVTPSEVLACLREHATPGEEVQEVSGLRVLSGGFSKEMLTATVRDRRGSRDIVIRKVAKGRTAHTLPGEFAALTFAWQHGIPVPRPLWLDESALGEPAFATDRSAGRCLGDVWGPSEPVSPRTAEQIAEVLARLHALDTSALPATPLPPMGDREEIVGAIDERRAVLDAVADATQPYAALFALVLAWLREHVPGDVARPVVVHGDFGLHNILVGDSGPTAVLDWERAHLGDPAEDLAYVRPSIEQILPWESFLRTYQEAGGPRPDPDRLAYYAVWHDAWRGISAYRMRTKFLADPVRISDAMAGLLMAPRFLLRSVNTAFGPTGTAC